jgi:hypothetical protein
VTGLTVLIVAATKRRRPGDRFRMRATGYAESGVTPDAHALFKPSKVSFAALAREQLLSRIDAKRAGN